MLGTIDAQRDWGHAEDYVEGMRLMLQQDKPDDYVLATGETNSVKDFASMVLEKLEVNYKWVDTDCYDENDRLIITTDKKFKRPAEVDILIGDSTKARTKLGWKPKFTLDTLIDDMLKWDLKRYG